MQSLNQTKWADHLRGCAQITNEITKILDIRDDAARQATFATVCIDATKHNIFVEPIPESKAPVIQPETAAAVPGPTNQGVEAAAADKQAADKADAQIRDVPKVASPEQDIGVRRSSFLQGINSARELLNKEGHVPPITPAGLNAAIAHQFPGKNQLGTLDIDELEKLLIFLSSKLDALREKKATASKEDDDLGI